MSVDPHPVNPCLLDYRADSGTTTHSLGIDFSGQLVRINGSSQAYGVVDWDGQVNDYDDASIEMPAADLAEVLLKVQLGENWATQSGRSRFTIDRQRISLGSDSLYSPGPAAAYLDEPRQALLLLDTHELAFSSGLDQARAGVRLPAPQIERAFLSALRQHPDYLKRLKQVGFERTVMGLLREAHSSDLRIETISERQGLWAVHSEVPGHGAMLLATRLGSDGTTDLQVVDRVNGIRDRRTVTKAVVVTQSFFSSSVTQEYGGLTERMELVDFDRLKGMLLDNGWTSREPGFLMCPLAERPPTSAFISFSHKTRLFAVWLYNRLQGWGYRCFLDQVDLKPGEVILPALKKALASVDSILLCCSKEALDSHWVQKEIEFAVEREQQEGRTLVIPLDLDDALERSENFSELKERLRVDFKDWSPAKPCNASLRKVRKALDERSGAQKAGQNKDPR